VTEEKCSSIDLSICAALAVVVFAAYAPLWNAGFTNYDDTYYVTCNAQVNSGITVAGVKWAFCDLTNGNWHPLTWLSHMLDCDLYGLNPRGHHFTSVFLHAANTALLYILLRALTGARWPAAVVAALFGLHPVHVESVAWISERKDALSALFGILSLIAYAKYARAEKRRIGLYLLTLILFACGLMSKAMLVTWPFVMLLLDFWPLGRWGVSAKPADSPGRVFPIVLEKLPFVTLSGIVSVVTYAAQRAGGAMPSIEQMSMWERLSNVLHSYVAYIGKLLWPVHLAVIYPIVRRWAVAEILLCVALLVVASVLAWIQRKRRPFLAVGWCWFLGTLIPVIGLVQVGNQAMADRYAYLPSIGFFLMIVWTGTEMISRLSQLKVPAIGLTACALCGLGVVTWVQAGYWKSSDSLFQQAIRVTRNNFIAYNSLGFDAFDRGEFSRAKDYFETAVSINPASDAAWSQLGAIVVEQNDLTGGANACLHALQLNPRNAGALATLGLIDVKSGKLTEGIAKYRTAIQIKPNLRSVHFNLANALVRVSDFTGALQEYEEAVRLDPRSTDARNNLGYLLLRTHRPDEAIGQFRVALQLQPGSWHARFGLGKALEITGQHEEASEQLNAVRQAHPELFRAPSNAPGGNFKSAIP
jgi:tetratricopeptide (TPR) repeat protein